MEDIPEMAVVAATRAVFERCTTASSPAVKARQWLQGAENYRQIAQAALMAALPYLQADNPAGGA